LLRVEKVADHPLQRAAGAVLIVGVAYGLAFPDRTDYLGHFLAGFGATLGLLSLLYTVPLKSRPIAIVIVTLIAVSLGWATEETIFKLAIFDPVDFFNQSLGAVVAAAVVLGDPRGAVTGLWAFSIGFITLVAGFVFAFA
jgi:hypothetical protein